MRAGKIFVMVFAFIATSGWLSPLTAGRISLKGDAGLVFEELSGEDRAVKTEAVLKTARITDGLQEKGEIRRRLAITVQDISVIPPAAEIKKAILYKNASTGSLRPPFEGKVDFPPAEVEIVIAAKKSDRVSWPGEGAVEVDITDSIQKWVLLGELKEKRIIIGLPRDDKKAVAEPGIQTVDLASVRLEIEYGGIIPKHSLGKPVVTGVRAEQDRTVSLTWESAAPQEEIKGVKYWYEFEVMADEPVWNGFMETYKRRKSLYDDWVSSEKADELFAEITGIKSDTRMELEEFSKDAEEALGLKAIRFPVEILTKLTGKSWRDFVAETKPYDPGDFTWNSGDWAPLDIRYSQIWTDKVNINDTLLRVNMGVDMPREEIPYKFRLRAVCSNGQRGEWAESPVVKQENPGYIAWTARSAYRARYSLGSADRKGDIAYGWNYYDQAWGVRIAAAKDEFEPYQIFFKNDPDSDPVEISLELTPLKGDKGVIGTWAMFPYSQCMIAPTVGEKENKQPILPLRFLADPLAPAFTHSYHKPPAETFYVKKTVVCEPGIVEGWWVDIKVPGSAPAGIYRGEAIIRVKGGEDLHVPVELEVWDFYMPRRRTISTTFGDAGPSRSRSISFNRWIKMMHEHRANGYGFRAGPYIELYDPDPSYWGDEVMESINWNHYIDIARPYVDGSLFEDGVPISKVGLTGWYAGLSGIPAEVGWAGYTGNGTKADINVVDRQCQYFRELRLIAKRMGFLEKLWHYEIDEPDPNDPSSICTLPTMFMLAKKAIPEMKCMVTSYQPDKGKGWITAYNTNPTMQLISKRWFFPRTELGEEYWLYNAFTFLADGNSHMNQRMIPWYAWRQAAANWLVWITTYTVDWDWCPESGGDGVLAYPLDRARFGIRDSGWAPNLQLKQYREGMEDIEICELAAELAGYEAVRAIIEQCSYQDGQDPWHGERMKRRGGFRHYGGMGYNADPRALFKARGELAELIVKHRPGHGASDMREAGQIFAEASRLKAEGRTIKALQKVKHALQKVPESMEYGMFEIMCYTDLKMPDEAKESAIRLTKRNPSNGIAWKALGDVYAGMSRFEDAEDCWRKALTLDMDAGKGEEVRKALADCALDGTEVATGKVPAFSSGADASGFAGQPIELWPQALEGTAMYRGIGPWGGMGTQDPVPAGLPLFIARVELGRTKLPKGARIHRAYISYKLSESQSGYSVNAPREASNPGNAAVFAVIRPWNNEGLTWRTYDTGKKWAERGCGKEGIDRGPLYSPSGSAVIDNEKQEARLDITLIMRDWVSGRYPNCGLALIPMDGNFLSSGKLVVHYSL